MWVAIKLFFSSNVTKIIEGLGIAAAAVGAYASIFKQGKDSEKTDELQSVTKDGKRANAIEDKNRATLRDGDAAAKLQSDWSR